MSEPQAVFEQAMSRYPAPIGTVEGSEPLLDWLDRWAAENPDGSLAAVPCQLYIPGCGWHPSAALGLPPESAPFLNTYEDVPALVPGWPGGVLTVSGRDLLLAPAADPRIGPLLQTAVALVKGVRSAMEDGTADESELAQAAGNDAARVANCAMTYVNAFVSHYFKAPAPKPPIPAERWFGGGDLDGAAGGTEMGL
jgi:hypothetical protein